MFNEDLNNFATQNNNIYNLATADLVYRVAKREFENTSDVKSSATSTFMFQQHKDVSFSEPVVTVVRPHQKCFTDYGFFKDKIAFKNQALEWQHSQIISNKQTKALPSKVKNKQRFSVSLDMPFHMLKSHDINSRKSKKRKWSMDKITPSKKRFASEAQDILKTPKESKATRLTSPSQTRTPTSIKQKQVDVKSNSSRSNQTNILSFSKNFDSSVLFRLESLWGTNSSPSANKCVFQARTPSPIPLTFKSKKDTLITMNKEYVSSALKAIDDWASNNENQQGSLVDISMEDDPTIAAEKMISLSNQQLKSLIVALEEELATRQFKRTLNEKEALINNVSSKKIPGEVLNDSKNICKNLLQNFGTVVAVAKGVVVTKPKSESFEVQAIMDDINNEFINIHNPMKMASINDLENFIEDLKKPEVYPICPKIMPVELTHFKRLKNNHQSVLIDTTNSIEDWSDKAVECMKQNKELPKIARSKLIVEGVEGDFTDDSSIKDESKMDKDDATTDDIMEISVGFSCM